MELQQIIEGLNCFKTNQHPWPYGCIKGQIDVIEAAQEQLIKETEEESNA